MNRIFNTYFTIGLFMHPLIAKSADSLEMRGSMSEMLILEDTASAIFSEEKSIADSIAKSIPESDKNRQFQFILPLEGDVIYEPRLQVIISLGKDAYSSVSFLLDGRPIPVAAVASENLLTIDINNLTHGLHRLRVTFLDDSLKLLAKKEVPFLVQLPEPLRTKPKGPLSQSGTVFLKSEYRGTSVINQVKGYEPFIVKDETVGKGQLDKEQFPKSSHVLHSSYRLKYKLLEVQTRLSIQSRENQYRQASHRFGGRLNMGPWLSVKGGDVYPFMNDLVLRDTRVRGGGGRFAFVRKNVEWASLQVAHGELQREIAPHVLVYNTIDGISHDTIPGTYARELTAARAGFGSRTQLFSLGITLLKTKDKKYGWDEIFQDSIPHYAPEQNLVAGVDCQFSFWNHQIILFSDAGYSLWTANTDAAVLGSEDSRFTMTFSNFTPEDYKDFIVINSTTQFNEDYPLKNLALQCGARAGIPMRNFATESEVFYYNTGDNYRSEGNPFLSTKGEQGIKAIQRFNLLDNRLSMGAEGGYATRKLYELDTASNQLRIVSYKGDVRYAPQANLPSLWLGVNGVRSKPSETNGLFTASGFANKTLYMGGYHHILLGTGKLYAGVNYSLSVNKNHIYATRLDSAAKDTSFTARTKLFFSTVRYRRGHSPLIPFLRYSITSNGVRSPLNDVTMGASLAFSPRLSSSVSFQAGEYPRSNHENDFKFGQQMSINYILAQNHSIDVHEKFNRNGDEVDYNIGASYELLF